MADVGLFRPLWSDQILVEVERTLTGKRGLSAQKAQHRIRQMTRAFPDAMVEGYEDLIPSMTNDPKDHRALRQQRADYTDPTLSVSEFSQTFMPTVPGLAQAAEPLERGS